MRVLKKVNGIWRLPFHKQQKRSCVVCNSETRGWRELYSHRRTHTFEEYDRAVRTYAIGMTRKDKMREGFVARTFHIPIEIDDELRMMAVKDHLRFSEEAILAVKDHLRFSEEAILAFRDHISRRGD